MISAYVVTDGYCYAVALQEPTSEGINLRSFSGRGGWEEAWKEVLRTYPGDVTFILPPGSRFDAMVETSWRRVIVTTAPDWFAGFFRVLRRRLDR